MASKNLKSINEEQPILTKKASEVGELDEVELDDDVESLDDNESIDVEFSDKEEPVDGRTVAARQLLHDKLLSDVEAFLARGGQIQQVASNFDGGSTKRHVNKFGHHSM